MFNSKRILELEAELQTVKQTANASADMAIKLKKEVSELQSMVADIGAVLSETQSDLNMLYAKTGCTKYQVEQTRPK